MQDFCHLHCHSQYSLLDGASDIDLMMAKAANDGQTAVALTDHGNMFGAFKFVKSAHKNGIKPIVGCEFYLVEDRTIKSFEKSKGLKDKRYHQLLLAKNDVGYRNLSKLCSLGYTEGMYSKYPRIDKSLILKYHEGIIATSCCVGAEIPQAILNGDMEKAESLLKWWLDLFGEDFYIEIQRQKGMQTIDGSFKSQDQLNEEMILLAKKYQVKVIATNDVHYVEKEDSEPHDVLLAINTASFLSDEKRFKFSSDDYYFKTKSEMNHLFRDVPFAIENTMEIASKVIDLKLSRDVLLPNFPLPPNFKTQGEYLRHLTFIGAQKKYKTIDFITEERLNFELETIIKSGYEGYFLIVQDFTTTAREMGVSVGPGRGSAAGSAVAYCLGITNIDPIKYDLLFERFLNPERVSMPDIDIDFDDEGRESVINYVIEKYGRNQVAQIVTYGTLAAKSSLRDTGRVMGIPLQDVDKVAKNFPNHLGATLNKILADKDIAPKLKAELKGDDLERAYSLRKLSEGDDEIGKMIRTAKKIEGSVKSTGVHACGVIITPEDITNIIPVSTAKDSDMVVSQYDNSVAEDAGLLKMDFLGLKTLTIIKDALKFIKLNREVEIDIDEVPLDDVETYKLFGRGDTVGIFQYESPGMQKHLKDLKPDKFEDLIAMNALYRPGPLQYIPNYIDRRHGREKITYDLPDMEDNLKETYGITVYQEQVMLLSQRLAGFSKGQADQLRKAMGKKNRKLIDELFPLFLEGCKKNGHDEKSVEKVWKDWENFASYAFNKSHSTCYAFIAYQTAYLKTHYGIEYMTSVLNHNKNDVDSISFFIQEANRMGIKVLGPDINESKIDFSIANKEYIRFGLSAVKGIGEGPVQELLEQRKIKPFVDVCDIMKRASLRAVNKKCIDSLVLSGALDSFGKNRSQYFEKSGSFDTFIEHLLRFGNNYQNQKTSSQGSLFGDMHMEMIEEPAIPELEEWNKLYKLEKEKEVTGFYLSGHPLDDYKLEFNFFITGRLNEIESKKDLVLKFAGFITNVSILTSKRGTEYARFKVQDYNGSHEFTLFTEKFASFRHLLTVGNVIVIEGKYAQDYGRDSFSFGIQKVSLLEEVAKSLTKSITVKIPLSEINSTFIEDFDTLVKKHPGPHPFKMIIADSEIPDQVLEVVKKDKINACYELTLGLDKLGLQYRLN
jgi:DNA polymerase III subunit alpha